MSGKIHRQWKVGLKDQAVSTPRKLLSGWLLRSETLPYFEMSETVHTETEMNVSKRRFSDLTSAVTHLKNDAQTRDILVAYGRNFGLRPVSDWVTTELNAKCLQCVVCHNLEKDQSQHG